MQRSESFVSKRTRNSGKYTPGLYLKTKIIPSLLPTKKKYLKKKAHIPGMKQFKINLQSLILKNLKAKGGCLRSGLFIVTEEIEDFLRKNYSISKRWQINQFLLEDLGIAVKICRPSSPNSSISVTDFQSRMGNTKTLKYAVKVCIFFI